MDDITVWEDRWAADPEPEPLDRECETCGKMITCSEWCDYGAECYECDSRFDS